VRIIHISRCSQREREREREGRLIGTTEPARERDGIFISCERATHNVREEEIRCGDDISAILQGRRA